MVILKHANILITKKTKGMSLFETLLSLSVVILIVMSSLYWYLENQRAQKAIIFGKDIVSIITAFDKRIHLDGWDIDNFKNGKEWIGTPSILNMLNTEFIAKESSCGNEKSWVPVLTKEKSTQLLPCNIWSKIPYDFITKSIITPDEDGFIKTFKIIFQPKSLKSFEENFIYFNKAKIAANANDSLNVTGGHQYYFASIFDSEKKITNAECFKLKSECTLIAKYDREGGNEYLRVDGTNSMIGSAVTFKESKGHDKLLCIKWEKNTSNSAWESKTVECGIGIHKKTLTPVTVDIAVNSSTNQRIMLNRLCPIFTHTDDMLIDSAATAPCGILSQDDNGKEVAYQVIETASANKGLIKTLYTDTIFSDDINTNYINVKKDLTVLGNSKMDGTLNVKGQAQFDNNINLTKVQNAGTSCSPNGLLSRDSKGLILSCESGVWVNQSTTGMYAFFNSITCPIGWVPANGSGGTVDLRGQFLRSWDNGKGVDSGRTLGSIQEDDLKRHNHTGTTTRDGDHSHGYTSAHVGKGGALAIQSGSDFGDTYVRSGTELAGAHSHNLNINYYGGTETRPKNIALLVCMKK